MTARTFICVLLSACLAALLLAGSPPRASSSRVAPAPKSLDGPPGIGVIDATGLFRHVGAYPPLALVWQVDGRVEQVVGVYPHPGLADRVVAATRTGLFLSDDAGATWQALAEAAADRVGVIRRVAFNPEVPDTFFLATDHKGVWVTTDGGKTFKQVGTKQTGMASNDTADVVYFPGDRRYQTLLVAHGDAAAGISLSHDEGRSWRVVAPDYCVRRIVGGHSGDRELMTVGAKKSAPDIQSIYYCPSFDDYWLELVRDIIPTDVGISVLVRSGEGASEQIWRGSCAFVATADQGLCRLNQTGGRRVGPDKIDSFASVGVTWGPTADSQVLYAYEPRKLGFLASTDNWGTYAPAGTGLYTGPFVKEGACVRASANGTVFYAAVNDRLYVGCRAPAPIQVKSAMVLPAIVTFESEGYHAAMDGLREELRTFANQRFAAREAKRVVTRARDIKAFLSDTEFTVTAQVACEGGPPASVTVDLSRIGGSGLTPMYDNGESGDGAAGDGVYGTTFRLDPRRLKKDTHDLRRQWPGPTGLTVTAAAPDGKVAGAVAVFSIFDHPESFFLMQKGQPFAVKGEPWTKSWGGYQPHDISGYYALTFWIKTDAAEAEDVTVQLRDAPPFSLGTTTPPVSILKEGFVDGGKIAGDWRLVTIPLARLLKETPQFERGGLGSVILSGEGKATGSYWVNDIRFHISPEDVKAYIGAATK